MNDDEFYLHNADALQDESEDDLFRPGLETQISRRRLLEIAGATSAGAAILGSGLSGVARAAAIPDITWERSPVNFVFVDTQEPSHLDPAIEEEFDAFTVTRNIYDPLVWTDEAKSKLVPWLATSWKSSHHNTVHTFHLRKGVVFSDGSKLDAAGVKLNIDRYRAIGAPGEGYLLDDVKDVTVVNSMTVRITTNRPDAWLPAHMVKFPILSAAAITKHRTSKDPWAANYFASHAVGCGAYMLENWQHGLQITLKKNKHWWRGWHAGSIDKVVVKWVAESSTRVELVQSGQANFCTEWQIPDAISTGKMKGWKLHRYKTYDSDPVIFLNQQKPPLHIREVRQALQWSFDYAGMRRFFDGYAVPMNGVFPPFYPGVDKKPPFFKQNLAKARALFKQARVNPATLTLSMMVPTGYADLVATGTIAQAAFARLGIKVNVSQLPFGSIVAAYAKPSTAAMVTPIYNSPFTLDPSQFLSELQSSSFTYAFDHYNSSKLDKIVTALQATGNKNKQAALLHHAQALLNHDAPVIWGGTPQTLVPVPNYLHGYVMQRTDYRFPTLFYLMRVAKH
jgi:peptide/nickel transport system substrate-binding protein